MRRFATSGLRCWGRNGPFKVRQIDVAVTPEGVGIHSWSRRRDGTAPVSLMMTDAEAETLATALFDAVAIRRRRAA